MSKQTYYISKETYCARFHLRELDSCTSVASRGATTSRPESTRAAEIPNLASEILGEGSMASRLRVFVQCE
jgi:hypothetical protein